MGVEPFNNSYLRVRLRELFTNDVQNSVIRRLRKDLFLEVYRFGELEQLTIEEIQDRDGNIFD